MGLFVLRRLRHRLTCQQATELMTEYLEGALEGRDRTRFEAHLAHCDACVAYLSQMRGLVTALGRLPAEELPPPVVDELVALYRRHRRG